MVLENGQEVPIPQRPRLRMGSLYYDRIGQRLILSDSLDKGRQENMRGKKRNLRESPVSETLYVKRVLVRRNSANGNRLLGETAATNKRTQCKGPLGWSLRKKCDT